MFMPILLFSVFLAQTESPAELGIIAGRIAASEELEHSQPVQVVLLPASYANLWSGDVQKRLDLYWERYRPAFVQRKEFFLEVSQMAQRDAIQHVVSHMRRDLRDDVSHYIRNATPEGHFEFRNIPFGDYTVVALGSVGENEWMLRASIEVSSPIPQFLELKTHMP